MLVHWDYCCDHGHTNKNIRITKCQVKEREKSHLELIKTELIKITEIPSNVYESITREIGWYSVGLGGLRRYKNGEDFYLIGSGTLINIGETYGILTAQHVTALFRDFEEVGFIISPEVHKLVAETKCLHVVQIAKASEPSNGPDLSVVILPTNLLGTFKAAKSFYNISNKREEVLRASLDLDVGVWILFGFIDEQTIVEGPDRGFTTIKGFRALCGATGIAKAYVRGNYDFLEVGAQCGDGKSLPLSYGGASGGGLWRVQLMRSRDGEIQNRDPILYGLAFYQTEIEEGMRYIRCHGPRSIYEKVFESINNEFNK